MKEFIIVDLVIKKVRALLASGSDTIKAKGVDSISPNCVERQDVIEVFKELDGRGYGQYIMGRRGHPTRFEFSDERKMEEFFNDVSSDNASKSIVDKCDDGVAVFLPVDLSAEQTDLLCEFVQAMSS